MNRLTRFIILPLSAFLLLPSAFLLAQVPFRWIAETSRPVAQSVEVWHGETVWLEPTLTAHGRPLDLAGREITLWWQTNGMGRAWWSVPATTGGAPGQARAVWSPACDAGAAAYTFFIGASGPGGTAYRASGTLRMRASPGVSPAALPPPSAYGALAGEVAPLVRPLLSGLTNGLASADDLLPLGRALAAVDTNRATRLMAPDGAGWIDGTGGVWRVAVVERPAVVSRSEGFSLGDLVTGLPMAWDAEHARWAWHASGPVPQTLQIWQSDYRLQFMANLPSSYEWVTQDADWPRTYTPAPGSDAEGSAVVALVSVAVTSRVDGVVFASGLPPGGFLTQAEADALYARAQGGTLTDPVVSGTLTLNGQALTEWPQGGGEGAVIDGQSAPATVSGVTLGGSAVTAHRLYIPSELLGGVNGGFGFDSGGNPIVEMGVNAGQFGEPDTTRFGSLFRLDMRSGFLFFKVMVKQASEDQSHQEVLTLGISTSGKTYIGAGWDEQEGNIQANQSPADPAADLLVRGGLSVGSDGRDGTLTLRPSGAPVSPQPGMIYFDAAASHFFGYTGSEWVRLDNP